MKRLIICVELLVGCYTISISNDYIYTTFYLFGNENKIFNHSIIDRRTNAEYIFRDDRLIPWIPPQNPPVSLTVKHTELINDTLEINGFQCQEHHIVLDIHNHASQSSTIIKEEQYTADIELINTYLKEDTLKERLSYIGQGYLKRKKYIVESNEITHSLENKILISKITDIYETTQPDTNLAKIRPLLDKLNDQ